MYTVLNVFILISFLIEKAASQRVIKDKAVVIFQTINIGSLVVVPSVMIWVVQPNPGQFSSKSLYFVARFKIFCEIFCEISKKF